MMTQRAQLLTVMSVAGMALGAGSSMAQTAPIPPQGPDITVGDLMNSGTTGTANTAIGRVAVVGNVFAYGIGTVSCNPATFLDPLTGALVTNPAPMNSIWDDNSIRKPIIGSGMYRYTPSTGRFEQIGYGWLKHAFFALSNTLCNAGCQGTNGTALGINCSDPYTASRNAGSGNPAGLGPRYEVNPFTGIHAWGNFPFTGFPNVQPGTVDTTSRRLRVDQNDLYVAGATYFVDGQYVNVDDSAWGNSWNNSSYRRISSIDPAGSGAAIRFTTTTVRMLPPIYGWRDMTGGAASPVRIERIGIGGTYPARTGTWSTPVALGNNSPGSAGYLPAAPIGDGYMYVASNAINQGDGTWRYEYAIFNLTSERSAGSFSVPIPSGAVVSNVSIRQLPAHSGFAAEDARRNAAWASAAGNASVTWNSVTPYDAAQPRANNHIEWGTMWNFSFVSNVAPVNNVNATVGFYKPATAAGQPSSLSAAVWGPDPAFVPACYANCDGSTSAPTLNALDFGCFLNRYVAGDAYANCDGSTAAPTLNALDFGCFLQRYQQGCR